MALASFGLHFRAVHRCNCQGENVPQGAERSPLHHLHPKLTKLQLGMFLAGGFSVWSKARSSRSFRSFRRSASSVSNMDIATLQRFWEGFGLQPSWKDRTLEVTKVPGAGRGWLARREVSKGDLLMSIDRSATTEVDMDEETEGWEAELAVALLRRLDQLGPTADPRLREKNELQVLWQDYAAIFFPTEPVGAAYNLRLIHDLGAAYASEGLWEKAANVMLRGWKRADEMTDDKIRFRFLMKLCEASFRISKPRQAFAVLNSISGAPDNADLAALHAMSVQVYCAVGDVQKALSTFKKAISGQEYQDALTLLALVVEDLRAAKAFHPVRDAVKALKPKQDMQLGVIEHYVEAKDKQEQEEKTLAYKLASPKLFIGVVATVMFLLSLYLMFLLEQWSLKKWSIQK